MNDGELNLFLVTAAIDSVGRLSASAASAATTAVPSFCNCAVSFSGGTLDDRLAFKPCHA